MLDDAGRLVEPTREHARVADVAGVVGDHVAVWRRFHTAPTCMPEPPQGRLGAEGEKLERNWWREPLYALVRRRDHDEAIGRRGHHLLARVRGAAALDQPAVRSDLIRAVDGQIQSVELVERVDVEA